MAHELTKKADGTAAMFSVRETPWHRLGVVLDGPPEIDDALTLAGANFTVEKRPVCIVSRFGTGDRVGTKKIAGHFATVRTDTDTPLGVVGAGYTPLQNSEAFGVVQPLMHSGLAALETGGVLRDGADVWLQARFQLPPGTRAADIFGDEVAPFFLIANNHSGRRGVLCSLTPIRVVCANTLGMAEREADKNLRRAFTVRHTSRVKANTEIAARELYAGLVARCDAAAKQYELLRRVRLSPQEWTDLVLDPMAAYPIRGAHTPRTEHLFQAAYERAASKRAELTRLWTDGSGHIGNHSAWEAYQAVVEALDHDERLWPTRGAKSRRLASLLDGSLVDLKNAALDRLVEHSLSTERRN
jgi:phage/plasmid-like protein (TIGR03299 family)